MITAPTLLQAIRARVHLIANLLRAAPIAVRHYGSLSHAAMRTLRVLRDHGFSGLRLRAMILLQRSGSHSVSPEAVGAEFTLYPIRNDQAYEPKVSIIVPNYNHARYLPARLKSIQNQSYRNVEVILLDDHSTDDSVGILSQYAAEHPENTILVANDRNSGGAFNQWREGLSRATGELVWIAESDDYCDPNFLSELIQQFTNQAVMLAFCRTDFVDGETDSITWSTEEYLHDLTAISWEKPFVKSAHWLVNHAWGVKNIVPNVSSAVFRHPGDIGLLDDKEWRNLRLCGDWIFYLTIIQGGLVAYSPRTTNYYRQHQANTSVSAHKEDRYFREHEVVAKHLVSLYKVNNQTLNGKRTALQEHWIRTRGAVALDELDELYNQSRIDLYRQRRKRNIAMACYALVAGGGETFPIMLANMLKKRGYGITLFNCKQKPTEPGVRAMLDQGIPLLELDNLELTGAVFDDIGIEVVHSHHGWVDMTLASLLVQNEGIRHIITTHGMYEMLPPEQLVEMLPFLEERIDRFVYIADKNLLPFSKEFQEKKGFVRIDNALPLGGFSPIVRSELGIGESAFVLCVVSRAIPEKGWEEAIRAVEFARSQTQREIHLLLVGDGPEFTRLRDGSPSFVHLLGFRSNTRDYFATSDMGFLPSRFGGESYPLVIIDCLNTGKPVLASNIGEIKTMLQTDDGIAGAVFDLDEWSIPIVKVGNIIARFANNPDAYKQATSLAPTAARRFDPKIMIDKYEEVYLS